MAWKLSIAPKALKSLQRIAPVDQRRIVQAIEKLGADPFPQGSVKLSGQSDVHRLRVGNYRVLYSVKRSRLMVLAVKVGHGRDAYR